MSGVASANSAATSACRSRRAAGPSVVRAAARPQRRDPSEPRGVQRRHQAADEDDQAAGDRQRRRASRATAPDSRTSLMRGMNVGAVRRDELDRAGGDDEAHERGARWSARAVSASELLDEPAARGAERAANRELAAAVERARDEQVDRVRARDEQDAGDGRERRRTSVEPTSPTHARFEILHAPRGLLVLIRRSPDREQARVRRAQRRRRAAACEMSGRRRRDAPS